MSRYSGLELLRSELVRTLYQWWVSNSHGDIPDRADLDPMAVERLLPNMVIADVELDHRCSKERRTSRHRNSKLGCRIR